VKLDGDDVQGDRIYLSEEAVYVLFEMSYRPEARVISA